MEAFNTGDTQAIFELYDDFLTIGIPLSIAFGLDQERQQSVLFTPFMQLLIIDENEWSYPNAKAFYTMHLRKLCIQPQACNGIALIPWLNDNAQLLAPEMTAERLVDICTFLLESSPWAGLKTALRSVYFNLPPERNTSDLATREDTPAAYTLLTYLLAFTKVQSPKKVSG